MGYFPGVIQQLAPGDFQELIQFCDPIAHRHRFPFQCLKLCIFDVEIHNAVNVRRLIGNRASSCFSLMKPASLDDVCFGSLFMAAFLQITEAALLVFQTK